MPIIHIQVVGYLLQHTTSMAMRMHTLTVPMVMMMHMAQWIYRRYRIIAELTVTVLRE